MEARRDADMEEERGGEASRESDSGRSGATAGDLPGDKCRLIPVLNGSRSYRLNFNSSSWSNMARARMRSREEACEGMGVRRGRGVEEEKLKGKVGREDAVEGSGDCEARLR